MTMKQVWSKVKVVQSCSKIIICYPPVPYVQFASLLQGGQRTRENITRWIWFISICNNKLDFGIPKILFQSLGIEADQKMHQCIETGDDQVREVSVQDESGEQWHHLVFILLRMHRLWLDGQNMMWTDNRNIIAGELRASLIGGTDSVSHQSDWNVIYWTPTVYVFNNILTRGIFMEDHIPYRPDGCRSSK